MNKEQAKQFSPIFAAFADGKQIEVYGPNGNWVATGDYLLFNLPAENYRIKPEPKYRPWRSNEVPVGKVVKHKDLGFKSIISAAGNKSGLIHLGHINSSYTPQDLLSDWQMEDGTPCGVAE